MSPRTPTSEEGFHSSRLLSLILGVSYQHRPQFLFVSSEGTEL